MTILIAFRRLMLAPGLIFGNLLVYGSAPLIWMLGARS
jgi:hypothetical protein